MDCFKCPYFTGDGCGCEGGCWIDSCDIGAACWICEYSVPSIDGRYMCEISRKAIV